VRLESACSMAAAMEDCSTSIDCRSVRVKSNRVVGSYRFPGAMINFIRMGWNRSVQAATRHG
jgi:hypothetical protein